MSACQPIAAEEPWCATHDVLLDPAWPDAMTTRPELTDLVCPLAGEPVEP